MPKARVTRSSASKAKVQPIRKPIAKKIAPKKIKPAAKNRAGAKAVKKVPVAPKKSTKPRSGAKCLDLCLILDCTGSMCSWIQRSKDTLS